MRCHRLRQLIIIFGIMLVFNLNVGLVKQLCFPFNSFSAAHMVMWSMSDRGLLDPALSIPDVLQLSPGPGE